MVIFNGMHLIGFFVIIFVINRFSSGSLHNNNTNFEKPDSASDNATRLHTLELEAQALGIITPSNFYERIMQYLEKAKLSPRDLVGPMEVFARAQIMYDKLFEAYMKEVFPSNSSSIAISSVEEIPTRQNFYDNLTSFAKAEYKIEDQNEPTKIILIAQTMYDSMYEIYKQRLMLKDSTNRTEV